MIYWINAWLPVAIGIAIIVLESQPWAGSNRTSHPLRWIVEHLFGHLSTATWDIIHHLIRKAGHFIGYGLLGLAWLRAWWMTLRSSQFLPIALRALLGTALVAGSDEWHQSFLPNRTASVWDVLLDCYGAIFFYLIAYLFMRIFRPSQLRRGV